jgi:predicted TIM-barrel fold metal-dependent hydrolase
VIDFLGVRRQLLYPGIMGHSAGTLYGKYDDPSFFSSITGDRKAYASRLIDIHNGWCARLTAAQDRLRPVALLRKDTADELIAGLRSLIEAGIRVVSLAPDVPPGGVSPAHPRLDPLWELAAAADCALLFHIDASEKFMRTMTWREAPAFEGWMVGSEFTLDPWTMSSFHLPVQNFLTTMVLGGVFDRHPRLRVGTAEFGSGWVGPWAENMDLWYEKSPFPTEHGKVRLSLRPSDFVRRNIRVACFDFEPVSLHIQRYGFEDVFCFATDFPHHEGGKDTLNTFARSTAGLSAPILRKFFVENGKWIIPD